MLPIFLLGVIAALLTHSSATHPPGTYTAAVVEYHTIGNHLNGASSVLEKNVANYETFIQRAAVNGAEIVVFPEYGLTSTSPSANRTQAIEYAQVVPNVIQSDDEVKSAPCDQEEVSWVIRRISCSARDNHIYVVINLPEMVPCKDTSEHCSEDGFFIYNSNIAFDRHGNIISKYWKFNLFKEHAIDKPQEASHSTFTTDFNVTFGMFICFDILWKEPTFDLVNDGNVTDFVFPTAWFSELPFLSAVQIQESWSYGLRVNLLASNYNNPVGGGGGSGIFSGVHGGLSIYVPSEAKSKLLIATVPKIIQKNSLGLNESADRFHQAVFHSSKKSALNVIYEDIGSYNRSLPFKDGESEAVVCSGDLCCQFYADVQTYNVSSNSTYRFIAFSGTRYLSNTYKASFQICAVIHCLGDEFQTCGHLPKSDDFKPLIRSLRISGSFNSSQMVLPNSVDLELRPIRADLFEFSRKETEFLITSKNHIKDVLSMSIYGRSFQND